MNHVKILGLRSMVLAAFAMIEAFVDVTRGDNSIFAWAGVTIVLGGIFALSARVTPGPHKPFVVVMATVSVAVGAAAIIGGLAAWPTLLVWLIVVFGVGTGVAEILAARRGNQIPRNDHMLLGGASLMLALASLIGPLDPTWLSGVMVAWAAIGAVLAGTASVQWKDHIRQDGAKENES